MDRLQESERSSQQHSGTQHVACGLGQQLHASVNKVLRLPLEGLIELNVEVFNVFNTLSSPLQIQVFVTDITATPRLRDGAKPYAAH